jgi:hypothetical protein
MRLVLIGSCASLLALASCTADLSTLFPSDSTASTDSNNSNSSDGQSNQTVLGALQTSFSADNAAAVRGAVRRSGDYQLFDLGPSERGEEWEVSYAGISASGPFTIVLLDENDRLLQRAIVAPTTPLKHVMRRATANIRVGVGMAYGTYGGSFDLSVRTRSGVEVPAQAPQLVYLNFGSGKDVRVHLRSGISFSAFSGAMVGSDYANETDVIRDAIIAVMREDYAAYNVTILTSLDGPAPDQPHATIHFGGQDDALLGLADDVDAYNSDPGQIAVVYTDGFADFASMRLSPAQMGTMIGNVGSHELGHLLGLYHTREPVDVMDTTGSAWDLASGQDFSIAALESSVFPVGYEDSPQLLEDAVGRNLDASSRKVTAVAKSNDQAMKKLAAKALHGRCGTCLHLDDAAMATALQSMPDAQPTSP